MSLYKEFINSTTSWTVLETNEYFLTYKKINNVFFIKNLYISKDNRSNNLFFRIVKNLEKLAIGKDCSYVSCQVYEENPIFTKLVKFCFYYGFLSEHYDKSSNSYYLVKPLKQTPIKGKLVLTEEHTTF